MSESSEKCLTREEELEEIACEELDYGEERDCEMNEGYEETETEKTKEGVPLREVNSKEVKQ